jgi:hypothetical protein
MILANAKLLQQLRVMQDKIDLDELHKIIRSAATIRRAEIFQERSDTGKGMLKCREKSARLAEKKFKHQARQDREQESLHPGTVSFEDILAAALAPSPTDTAAQPTHGDAANTEDGRAQAPVRPGPPKAPSDEAPASTQTKPDSIQPATNEASHSSSSQSSAPESPSHTNQDAQPTAVPAAAPTSERQQSYWSNPISMSNQPPTPPPAETKPAAAQPLPPKPRTPEEEAESNPVKADQDRCRAKYRAAQVITRQSPENWQTQRIIHCA